MNSTFLIPLLLLLPLATYSMETPSDNANKELIALIGNDDEQPREYRVPKTALQFSDVLNATVANTMKEQAEKKIRLQQYDNETTQAIADLLISLDKKDSTKFFELMEQLAPNENDTSNKNLESFKDVLNFLQFNSNGYKAIAELLQQALKNKELPSTLSAFSFALQLLPQKPSTATADQSIPFLDSAALNSLITIKTPCTTLNNGSAVNNTIIKDNLLISGSDNGTINFWDLSARGNNVPPIATMQGHDNWVMCLVIKDNILVSGSGNGNGTIKFWDLSARGNNVPPIATLHGHNDNVRCLVIKDNLLISGSDDKTIKFWNLAARGDNIPPIATLQGHNGYVRCLVIKDNILISGSGDKTIKFWDLAARGDNVPPIATLQGHDNYVTCLVIKDNLLISQSADKTIKFWDLAARGDNVPPIATLHGHDNWVNCLVIKDNILVSGSDDKTIKFWNLAARGDNIPPVATLIRHVNSITCLLIKDNLLISGSHDKTIKLWDIAARGDNVPPIATLQGHGVFVGCLLVKDNVLISGSGDRTIKFWDLTARGDNVPPIATLQGHNNSITCLLIKDNLLISGSHDNTIKFWDLSCFTNLKKYFQQELTFMELLVVQSINSAYEEGQQIALTELEKAVFAQLSTKLQNRFGSAIADAVLAQINKHIKQ